MFLWILFGYLFGSFPSGYVVFRLMKGADIRKLGSGNIGATNVGRFLGKKWAVIVASMDMFKGGVAILLAMSFGTRDPFMISLIGLAGVCGHNFPLWLGFKGGKGVSTTFGVIIFFSPPWSFVVGILGGIVWLCFLKITQYVSLASLISLFSIPVFFLIIGSPFQYSLTSLLLAILSLCRHQQNIRRILTGTEVKIGQKKE